VVKGLPNSFVDSLTHDSIIVQIPRLHGRINNRLDKVLSIFDQTRKDENDNRLLRIDPETYADDSEMERILHRLTMAAADADMRHKMNVEDEYFSIIEKRDTEILMRDKLIAEKNTKIAEQNTEIAEKNSKIAEQNTEIAEQNSKIAEQDKMIRNTIKMLLDAGKSLEDISQVTGLSPKDIEKLS